MLREFFYFFLGFAGTTKNIVYLCKKTNKQRYGTHIKFDDVNQMDIVRPTQALLISEAFGGKVPIIPTLKEDDKYNLHLSPIPADKVIRVEVPLTKECPTIGLEMEMCQYKHRPNIKVDPAGTFAKAVKNWERFNFAYL